MKEYVGSCSCCGNDVYCLDGFFNGILTEDKKIICFDCLQMAEKNPQG